MSCASCAKRIGSAIGNAEGVSKSIVNFATRKATVTGSVAAEETIKLLRGWVITLSKKTSPPYLKKRSLNLSGKSF